MPNASCDGRSNFRSTMITPSVVLVGLCNTPQQRREALQFVKDQLIAQVIAGEGLLSFRAHAELTLAPDELLQVLRDALAARPELWEAWSALAQQLLQCHQLDEAWSIIQQATDRFPLMPRLWIDRAQVCHARLDHAGELAAIEAAHRINPSWSMAVRMLAAVHQREGRFEDARQVLEQGLSRNPLDAIIHVSLGDILWTLGQRNAALEKAERAVQLEPGYERGWNALDAWGAELNQPERALDSARQLTRRRPGEASLVDDFGAAARCSRSGPKSAWRRSLPRSSSIRAMLMPTISKPSL